MKEEYTIYSKFDLEKHKQTFINYFEAFILPDGTIEYAIPSHNEYIYNYLEKTQGMDRELIYNMSIDLYDRVMENCGLVACWSNRYDILTKQPTDKQIRVLSKLIKEKLTTNNK